MISFIKFLFFLTFSISNPVSSNPVSTTEFFHFAQLDPRGLFVLFWKFDEENITFQAHAATKGWAGIGFSPNGGMAGADIAVFWVNSSGKGVISDRYATVNGFPKEDGHQDYTLIDATKNDTHLVVTFSRKRNTCDQQDWAITDGTTRVIYGLNNAMPEGKDKFQKHSLRGTKSLHLFDDKPLPDKIPPEKDAKYYDFRVNKVRIPDDESTTYWCEIMRLPKFDSKMHVIRIDPLIEQQNIDSVHHILVYMCTEDIGDDWIGKGRSCLIGKEQSEDPIFDDCKKGFLAGWAVGGENTTYPDELGFPFYPDAGFSYIMLEIHYDNSELKKGKVDSSGMRIWVTENLRPIDVGQAAFGLTVITDEQLIPPGVKEFTNYGYCTPECTAEFPKEGIKILGGFLHTHLAGRKIRVMHFRNGKQLAPLIADEHYDFNYQDIRRLKNPPTVLPGDQLVVECVYGTLDRTKPTFSGYSTRDEMCETFLEYYPAIYRGFACGSTPDKREVYKALGIPFNESDPTDTDVIMPDGKRKSLSSYFREDFNIEWTKEKIDQLQKGFRDAKHTVVCFRQDLNVAIMNFTPNADNEIEGLDIFEQYGYPKITEPWVAPDECNKNIQENGR